MLILVIITTFVTPLPIFSEQPSRVFELDITPQANKSWTFMLYFCGDTRDDSNTQGLDNSGNKLNTNMQYVFDKLVTGDLLNGFETDLNIIALFDHPYSPEYPNGQAKLYDLKSNGFVTIANYGPKNMGYPTTLSNFISFCKNNYTANNYALLLSDHGRGYAGFCYDYHAHILGMSMPLVIV